MRLGLLRHAHAAADDGRGDFSRPLNARGRDDARRVAAYLADDAPPTLIACSPAQRTIETARAVMLAVPQARLTEFPSLYNAPVEALEAVIKGCVENSDALLLVGHNPAIGQLAYRLADGATNDFIDMPPAGLAVFDVEIGEAPGALQGHLIATWKP